MPYHVITCNPYHDNCIFKMVGKRRRSCPSILKCAPICTVLVLFFIWVPFIVCDLYFAYTDYYCTE